MKWKTRLVLREGGFTAVAFTAAVYSYYLIAFWGVQDQFVEGPLRDYLSDPVVHVELLLSGILFGGLIGFINRVTETPRLRRRSVGQVVVLRTLLYLAGVSVVAGVVLLVFTTMILPLDALVPIYRAMTPRHTLSFALWMVLAVGAINFALELQRVVGPGNLWRLLVGRYRRPREEERVFLFMDLRGSTTIAEALGHRRYSALLQECFRDLTEVVLRHEAAIYQYVGDEVVVSWDCRDSTGSMRKSVRAFFDYAEAINGKAEEYEARFGTGPTFRGGIDVGAATVIEVGDVKREIVYHGDVLNTAARLLELGKMRGEALVVSRAVGEAVEGDNEVRAYRIGEVRLRGKRGPVEAYGLQASG